MQIYIQRKNGTILVKQVVKAKLYPGKDLYRTIKTIKDTPEHLADILRWADVVGHTVLDLDPEPSVREI